MSPTRENPVPITFLFLPKTQLSTDPETQMVRLRKLMKPITPPYGFFFGVCFFFFLVGS